MIITVIVNDSESDIVIVIVIGTVLVIVIVVKIDIGKSSQKLSQIDIPREVSRNCRR